MNERIKELAGKALDKAVPYTWTQLDYDQIQELLACHAELIVRECMDICKKHPSRDLDNLWSADAVAPHLVQLFEEHFGVEE